MKKKIAILIIASIVALIALSAIQAYLIANTYELKKKAFIKETSNLMFDINDITELDSLYNTWGDDLKNHIADYLNNRISKDEVVIRLKKQADSLNPNYKSYFLKEQATRNLNYDVDFKMNIKSIVILDRLKNDTLYSSANKTKIRLFGDDFDEAESYPVNTSRWFSEHDFIEQKGTEITTNSFDLEVKTESIMLIKGWRHIVFGRMASLFIGSVLLFLFVIGLMYYSIKNLITQKKIAEIKTDFINNITHELKTPLATLSIATKSLQKEEIKQNNEAFSSTLNIVERQNERLQKLIDQVMTNSLSSEEIVLNKEQVLDNEYFNNIIEDFKLSKQHNNLTITNNIEASEIVLRLDKFHFETALFNILENAVKYGVAETEINFKTELKNGQYHLYIKDNGIGISEKDQRLIFDKFYRVNDGDLHNVKGLGLGLYYTYQIIKAHNGSIHIESEVNKCSLFTIKIPVN